MDYPGAATATALPAPAASGKRSQKRAPSPGALADADRAAGALRRAFDDREAQPEALAFARSALAAIEALEHMALVRGREPGPAVFDFHDAPPPSREHANVDAAIRARTSARFRRSWRSRHEFRFHRLTHTGSSAASIAIGAAVERAAASHARLRAFRRDRKRLATAGRNAGLRPSRARRIKPIDQRAHAPALALHDLEALGHALVARSHAGPQHVDEAHHRPSAACAVHGRRRR